MEILAIVETEQDVAERRLEFPGGDVDFVALVNRLERFGQPFAKSGALRQERRHSRPFVSFHSLACRTRSEPEKKAPLNHSLNPYHKANKEAFLSAG